jgi:predicted RNase H-like nuclease (RuvC/YqgF family)
MEIKKYIRRKNRIHKKAKKTNAIVQWEKFRKIRNKCNKFILNAKQSYINISVISGTEVSESLRSACLQK